MAPNTDIATRSLIVALKAPHGGRMSSAQISQITGLSARLISQIYARAVERGFEPKTLPLSIRNEHVQDKPRTGRPLKQRKETTEKLIAEGAP